MPAFWDTLSYTMLTTEVNMHHLVCAAQFLVLLFTVGACSYHTLSFKSPSLSIYGFKGNFQGWEMKGMGHSETTTLSYHHCLFMLFLTLLWYPLHPCILLPTSTVQKPICIFFSFLPSPKVYRNYVYSMYLQALQQTRSSHLLPKLHLHTCSMVSRSFIIWCFLLANLIHLCKETQ